MNPVKIKNLKPLKDHIIVKDMNFGNRTTSGGIFLISDDMKDAGIRPRWAEVLAIGPKQEDIKVGQWICVAHGRWTRGVKVTIDGEDMVIRRIDHKEILLVSDEKPEDDTLGLN